MIREQISFNCKMSTEEGSSTWVFYKVQPISGEPAGPPLDLSSLPSSLWLRRHWVGKELERWSVWLRLDFSQDGQVNVQTERLDAEGEMRTELGVRVSIPGCVILCSHLSVSPSIKTKIGIIMIISGTTDGCKGQKRYAHILTHNISCILYRHTYVYIQMYIVIMCTINQLPLWPNAKTAALYSQNSHWNPSFKNFN